MKQAPHREHSVRSRKAGEQVLSLFHMINNDEHSRSTSHRSLSAECNQSGKIFSQEKDTWEDLVLQLILAERLLYAELHSPFQIVCMAFQ